MGGFKGLRHIKSCLELRPQTPSLIEPGPAAERFLIQPRSRQQVPFDGAPPIRASRTRPLAPAILKVRIALALSCSLQKHALLLIPAQSEVLRIGASLCPVVSIADFIAAFDLASRQSTRAPQQSQGDDKEFHGGSPECP